MSVGELRGEVDKQHQSAQQVGLEVIIVIFGLGWEDGGEQIGQLGGLEGGRPGKGV